MVSKKEATYSEESLAVLSESETQQIVAQLADDVGQLQILSQKIEASEKASQKASQAVDAARKSAAAAMGKVERLEPVRLFHKKQAIEDLQDAVGDLASAQTVATNAQINLAEAQKSLSDAQRVTFECQEKIANLSKAMIQIGCASIATSQVTVRQLEARLNGASKKELSDLARNELLNVVTQIKSQQNLLGRQAQIEEILKEHNKLLTQQEEADSARDKAIIEQAEKGLARDKKIALQSQRLNEQQQLLYAQVQTSEEHERRLSDIDKDSATQKNILAEHSARLDEVDVLQSRMIGEQAEKDAEHDRRLDAGDEKDQVQDAELERQAEKDVEHDRRLDAGDEKDQVQDAELEHQAEKDVEHDRRLDDQAELIAKLTEEINRLKQSADNSETNLKSINERLPQLSSKALAVVATVCSAAALLLGIIHFFI